MSLVSQTMKNQFPQAVHSVSEVFTAVADWPVIAEADVRSIQPV